MTGEGRCGRWREEVGLPSVVGNTIELSRGTDVEVMMGSSATRKKNTYFKSKYCTIRPHLATSNSENKILVMISHQMSTKCGDIQS